MKLRLTTGEAVSDGGTMRYVRLTPSEVIEETLGTPLSMHLDGLKRTAQAWAKKCVEASAHGGDVRHVQPAR
jgi:hypothetical protein